MKVSRREANENQTTPSAREQRFGRHRSGYRTVRPSLDSSWTTTRGEMSIKSLLMLCVTLAAVGFWWGLAYQLGRPIPQPPQELKDKQRENPDSAAMVPGSLISQATQERRPAPPSEEGRLATNRPEDPDRPPDYEALARQFGGRRATTPPPEWNFAGISVAEPPTSSPPPAPTPRTGRPMAPSSTPRPAEQEGAPTTDPPKAASPVQAKTAQEIARRTFPSTVMLVMENAAGQPLTLGSGFLVGAGMIATNLHVLEGADAGYAKFIDEDTQVRIEGVVAIDRQNDLAILKASSPRAAALVLGDSDSVEVGEVVYVVGNPNGLEGTFSQGIVSGVRRVDGDTVIQTTAPISPGSSGGPVLNAHGEVIGLSVATIADGQNLNFAIPANYLSLLLAKVGPVQSLATVAPRTPVRPEITPEPDPSPNDITVEQVKWKTGWGRSGELSFSIHNHLNRPVNQVRLLMVFREPAGNVIDTKEYSTNFLTVPAGLARRFTTIVPDSVSALIPAMEKAVEFRVLDYRIQK